MLLQRCIESGRYCALLLALLVFGGCAGGGLVTAPTTSDNGASPQAGAAALTLYEQATAIMAAGDFVEAEKRIPRHFQTLLPAKLQVGTTKSR